MKVFNHLLVVLVASSQGIFAGNAAPDDNRDRAVPSRELQIQERAAECARAIQEASQLPSSAAIPRYGDALRWLGGWKHRADVKPVHDLAQAKLLSIPGHAYYYRDKIQAAKRAVRDGEMRIGDWDNVITEAFDTLKHLPSEEAVEVLAGLVGERFGCHTSTNPEDMDFPEAESRGMSIDASYPVAGNLAWSALEALGIESQPARKGGWKAWWQGVQAGKIKYRFKDSDIWHPVQAPSAAVPEERSARRTDPVRPTAEDSRRDRGASGADRKPASGGSAPGDPWFWPTVGGFGALLGLLAWLLLRRPGGSD